MTNGYTWKQAALIAALITAAAIGSVFLPQWTLSLITGRPYDFWYGFLVFIVGQYPTAVLMLKGISTKSAKFR